MIIVADENIPCVIDLFGSIGDVRLIGGREIQPRDVRHADVLLVRSVTSVNRTLLADSRVRFVGSATIGTDHVDLDYLRAAGITFAHAPGSNADSVVEYVACALLRLSVRKSEPLRGKKMAIVGVGAIGSRLADRLPALGIQVLLNDPPRLAKEGPYAGKSNFRSLNEVLQDADIVSLHVPLVHGGSHPTFHMIDERCLRQLKPSAWLLNTARGSVIDNGALVRSMRNNRQPAAVVLDVWENEPEPDPDLVRRVDIATPHVAGYALDAKLRGVSALFRAMHAFLSGDEPAETSLSNKTRPLDVASRELALPCIEEEPIAVGAPDPTIPETEWLDMFVRRMYDIERDHVSMMGTLSEGGIDGACFSRLRREYPIRREFATYTAPKSMVPLEQREAVGKAFRVSLT